MDILQARSGAFMNRHVLNKQIVSSPSKKRDFSPPLHYEKHKDMKKSGRKAASTAYSSKPYQVSTPSELWFVPDEMYMVDSKFSRARNLNELTSKFDIVPDLEKSDENHLVWPNYHELTPVRIESFLKLNPSGVYILIDCLKWAEPSSDDEYNVLDRHFNKLANDYIDKIARIISQNQAHFGRTSASLNGIAFHMEVFNSDGRHRSAAKRFRERLPKFYELYAAQKNLNWKFEMIYPKDDRAVVVNKFYIEIHMNTSSYFMGLKLLDWNDTYKQFKTSTRFGTPIIDLLRLANISQGMIVLDLDIGFAENIQEMSKIAKCHSVGLVFNKRHAKTALECIEYARRNYNFNGNYHDIIINPIIDQLPDYFDVRKVDCILYRTSDQLNGEELVSLMDDFKKLMSKCSSGCIFFFIVPADVQFGDTFKYYFGMSTKYDMVLNTKYTEIRKQRRIIKIIKK